MRWVVTIWADIDVLAKIFDLRPTMSWFLGSWGKAVWNKSLFLHFGAKRQICTHWSLTGILVCAGCPPPMCKAQPPNPTHTFTSDKMPLFNSFVRCSVLTVQYPDDKMIKLPQRCSSMLKAEVWNERLDTGVKCSLFVRMFLFVHLSRRVRTSD